MNASKNLFSRVVELSPGNSLPKKFFKYLQIPKGTFGLRLGILVQGHQKAGAYGLNF